MDIPKKVAQKLVQQKKSLAIAESCTGGLLSSRLTDIPGSSGFFKGSIIAYSNAAKSKLLKIPPSILKKHGAVSRMTAERMAQNTRKVFRTDLAVSITGILGPTGATKDKPVGLVHIAVCSNQKTIHTQLLLKGNRLSNKDRAAAEALQLLLKLL